MTVGLSYDWTLLGPLQALCAEVMLYTT